MSGEMKDKRIVVGKLHEQAPTLGLLNNNGDIDRAKWKLLMADFHIIAATMGVLLQMPSIEYFSQVRQLKLKNMQEKERLPSFCPIF